MSVPAESVTLPVDGLLLPRRTVVVGLLATVAAWRVGLGLAPSPVRADTPQPPLDPRTRATLEAFADTMVPGEKRHPGDRAVAGAATGPGAVHAGAIDVLTMPEAQVAALLPVAATLLDTEATAWAAAHGRLLDPTIPPFVGLGFDDRTRLCARLLHPRDTVLGTADYDRRALTLVALMAFVAFHTAGHQHTVDAVQHGHPGLAWLRFPAPRPDGSWGYHRFSYGRRLARRHPATTPSGSPA